MRNELKCYLVDVNYLVNVSSRYGSVCNGAGINYLLWIDVERYPRHLRGSHAVEYSDRGKRSGRLPSVGQVVCERTGRVAGLHCSDFDECSPAAM